MACGSSATTTAGCGSSATACSSPATPARSRSGCSTRGSYFLSLGRSLLRGGRYDAVMAFCPLAGTIACAALHKLIRGGPLWLSVQDLPADAAAAGGIARRGPARALLQATQRALFNRADVWQTISPVMAERLEALRSRDQPILTIPNWLHASLAGAIAALPSKLGRPAGDPVRLLYSGNIGTKQGLLEFCRSLSRSSGAVLVRDPRRRRRGGIGSRLGVVVRRRPVHVRPAVRRAGLRAGDA